MQTVADRLGMSVEEAALGALQIQKYGMTQAIELNSVRRGYDPREFTLVAAGGAGPLFACDIALELEIPRVLVPAASGHHRRRPACSRPTSSTSSSPPSGTPLKTPRPRRGSQRALRRARRRRPSRQLDADGVPERPAARAAARRLPLRRPGLRGALRRARAATSTTPGSRSSTERFHAAHEREYGHRFDAADRDRQRPRASASGASTSSQLDRARGRRRRSGAGEDARARGRLRGRRQRRAPRRRRSTSASCCAPATGSPGRRSIEQYDSTTVIPPGLDGRDRPLRQHRHRLHARRGDDAARGAGLATPILMRVIGGAFAVDREGDGRRPLPHVATRRSSASPRTSAPASSTAEGNELAESDSTPMFMGAMPKIVKDVIRILGDDIHEGDVILHNDPYARRHALAGRRDRRSRSSSRASSSASPAPRRTCSTSAAPTRAWRSTSSTTGRRGTSTARSSCQEKGVWQERALEAHPRERRARRRYNSGDIRGDDRRLRAGEAALRRAARPLRPGDGARRGARLARLLRADAAPGDREGAGRRATRPRSAGSTTTACNRGVQLPVKVAVDDRGRRDHVST